MEKGNEFFLQFRAQIDEQVAATDQVEFGERRVFQHVLLGKHQHVADAFVNAIGATVGLDGEKSRQPFRREVCGDAGRVQAGARGGDGPAVDVGCEELHRVVLLERVHALLQEDGDGIGLLSGGAAGRPDAHHGAGGLVVEEPGNDLFLKHLAGFRIAEEIGHADQQVAKQRLHLRRRLLQIPDITVDRVDLVDRHAPFDAAVDRARLVLRKVMTGLGPQQDENLLQRVWIVSVFSLFIFTEAFHSILTNLVQAAQSGETNIISLIASDIHKVAPEVYIQKYFTLFIQLRAIFFYLFTCLLVYFYYRSFPSAIRLLLSAALPAILLGFTTSIRILGPLAGLIITYYALRTKGKQAIPVLIIYAIIAIVTMYLTWPYLWTNPVGHLVESLKVMSLYPWRGQVLFNGVAYASTELPYSYLPVLFGIQLTEPVWVLFIAGLAVAVISLGEKRELIELTIIWFIIPFIGFIILRSALYDNFRQIIFILPPIFLMAGVAFEKIKRPALQIILIVLVILPGIVDGIRLHPYEYIYYNRFIGGRAHGRNRP